MLPAFKTIVPNPATTTVPAWVEEPFPLYPGKAEVWESMFVVKIGVGVLQSVI